MEPERPAPRRFFVTWVVLPGAIAVGMLAIAYLMGDGGRTAVESLEPAREAAPSAPAEASPPDGGTVEASGPGAARGDHDPDARGDHAGPAAAAADPALEGRTAAREAPAAARDPALGERTAARASTRDSSGERAPVAVPTRAPAVIERPQLERAAATPAASPAGAVEAAGIDELRRCPTMQSCIRAAAKPLASFGYTAPLPDPGAATIAGFEDTRGAYRRALSEVRTAAKGLVEQPGGAAHEATLRAMFEALPQSGAFELAEHELQPLRRALERAAGRWLADRRAAITSPLALQIRLLTPAGDQPLEMAFEHGASAVAGLSDLKRVLREELAGSAELKSYGRQRFATVKLVLNPGGRFGLD